MSSEPDAADGELLAMFPLGSVLLPGMALPLRVFEPRYRLMLAEVLESDPPRFGVALIERGSEVGGGDTRTQVGCEAIVRATEEMPGGELAVVATGGRRIRVQRWLPDDPYPRAVVQAWPEPVDPPPTELDALTDEVVELARMAVRMGGGRLPDELEFSPDPVERVYQLATLAPLGPLDRLKVLSAPSLTERLPLLADLVIEQRMLIEARDRFDRD